MLLDVPSGPGIIVAFPQQDVHLDTLSIPLKFEMVTADPQEAPARGGKGEGRHSGVVKIVQVGSPFLVFVSFTGLDIIYHAWTSYIMLYDYAAG